MPAHSTSPSRQGPRTSVRIWGGVAIALALLATAEVVSYGFLDQQQKRASFWFKLDIDTYVDSLNADQIAAFADARARGGLYGPDADLGWTRLPGQYTRADGTTTTTNKIGSRVVPGASGPVKVATYGDSFTAGVEVDDDVTYQAELGRLAGIQVENFGVTGYGPTQALLALERNLAQGQHAPVVILAVIFENTNRLVNTFRMFYTYPIQDMTLGFKPVLVPDNDGFEVFVSVPRNWTDREAIREAIHKASDHDAYYKERTVKFGFPFTWRAIQFISQRGLQPNVVWPGTQPEAIANMAEVIRRFHASAEAHNFIPVFVLLPDSERHIATRGGEENWIFGPLIRDLDLDGLIFIDVVQELSRTGPEALVPDFDPSQYQNVTHPSAYGNAAIAKVLYHRLEPLLSQP